MVFETDILIIGSGCGGGTVAHELSLLQTEGAEPARVLIVEAGPETTPEYFNNREYDMSVLFQDGTNRFTSDRSTQIIQGRCVGGGSLLYTGTAHLPPPETLARWGKEFGVRGYSSGELAPHFSVMGNRLSRFVHDRPELWNDNNRYFWGAMEAKGYQRGFLSQFAHDCIGCGFCYYGCRFHRKKSAADPLIPEARKNGAILLPNCSIDTLLFDSSRRRVIGARGRISKELPGTVKNRHPEGPIEIRARLTVVAGGAVNTPALLLNSKIPGLSPALGKYHISQTVNTVNMVMPFPVQMIRGLPKTSTLFEYQCSHRFIVTPSQIHPITTAVDITGFGPDYHETIRRFDHLLQWQLISFDEPVRENQVCVVDGRPEVDYHYTEEYIDRMIFGLRTIARMALEPPVSARRVYIGPSPRGYLTPDDLPNVDRLIHRRYWKLNRWNLNTAHPQGGCRMGKDFHRSVVDESGRVHGVQNLIVADSSVFPTSANTNPAFLIFAVARKIAMDTKRNLDQLLSTA